MSNSSSSSNSFDHDLVLSGEPPITLLLVSDDLQIRQALASALTAGGYTVSCAEDGLDALEQAERTRFPVVVSDLNMPRMNGVELVRALAELDPYIESILLSSSEDLSQILEASEVGNVFDHVWKPLPELGSLMRSVARALDRRALRLANAYLLSELRDSRGELRILSARLEQLDKVAALGQMTDTVARDLKNPLMSLLAYAQYLRARLERDGETPLSNEQMNRILEYMQDMEQGVRQCYDTVKSVLDYTQVHEEAPAPTSLNEILGEALGLMRQGLETRGVNVSLNMASALSPVLANPRRLQQAIVNILLNAQQAMGESGGSVQVTTERRHDAADREIGTQLQVVDTGAGIAPGALPHIFDAFFTTRPRPGSLGLGLTIARNIVREFGGDIQVSSERGRGTTVCLNLPLCAEATISLGDDLSQAA